MPSSPTPRRPITISPDSKQDWFSQNGYGYVRLTPGADPAKVVAGMAPAARPQRDAGPEEIRHPVERQPGLSGEPDALHPGPSGFVTLAVQPDAAGKLDHGLWRRRHRRSDPAGGLLQFHEPGDGARHDAGARDRPAQDIGRQPRPVDRPVPGRIGADGAAGAGAGAWRWWRYCCRPSTVSCSGPSVFIMRRLAAAAGRSSAWRVPPA